ncbi:MAG: hypothetical protein M3Q27_07750, partial [Actinomycetota bacterium]|nr:hypothetical protein [Actinomycetota bacterium]
MRPSRPGVLAALAGGAGLTVYVVLAVSRALVPPVPWSLPALLLGAAGAVVAAAVSVRRRLT